ncbi:MAG TPA: hypothetical protein VGK58_05760, partial [Lacipirellulaceae bacterium]
VLIAAAMLARPVACRAQITVGHVDDFQDGTTQSWLGANVEAVADAGPNGAGDTALRSSATGARFGANGKLIVYNDADSWTGNWTAAGVVQISLDVKNPNTFPLSMRLGIAGPDGFFGGGGGDAHATDGISVAGDNAWHSISFDVLADNFTPLNPTHPDAAAALADVTHFRILHHPEHSFIGEAIDADFLVDNIRTIGATAMVPGDYNHNGMVDAADYVVWRKMLNQTVTPGSGADGTGPAGEPDGLVNSLDYDFWRSQFGSPAPGSGTAAVAVPEPSALAVVLGFMPALLGRRRSLRLSR